MAEEKKRTQTEILKHYLLEKDNAYLLNDNNNGKTIMLSGAWGSGKTHFWKEEIEDDLKTKLNNKDSHEEDKSKACIYVSLYGKTSIESIELDIYMKAYQNIVGDADFVSKTCSVFTNLGKNLGNMAHKGVGGMFSWMENLVDKDKFNKAGEYLENGGVICFDDFERKSKDIDLNDLFGFISQLALEYNCKIIIILNSDIFEGKEAEIFHRVKEKTISKYFYFNPSIEELFISISNNSKYNTLNKYKPNILSAIKETKELNARIYTQVLDNCLEWIEVKELLNKNIIRVLTLSTFNFVLNHIIFDFRDKYNISNNNNNNNNNMLFKYKEINFNNFNLNKILREIPDSPYNNNKIINLNEEKFIEYLLSKNSINDNTAVIENKDKIKSLWKYGYRLRYLHLVDNITYNKIANFIRTGILLP